MAQKWPKIHEIWICGQNMAMISTKTYTDHISVSTNLYVAQEKNLREYFSGIVKMAQTLKMA